MSFRFAYASSAALYLGFGCASTKVGATPDDLARARSQSAAGDTVYANECASCHGGRGEGLAGAPAIMANLKDADYWAVSYLLAVQGVSLPTGGIGPSSAASIPIPKR